MKWENLRKKACPFCGDALKEKDNNTLELGCVSCTFTITHQRFISMVDGAPQPMRWPNLRDGRCAYLHCGAMLRETEKNTHLVRCSNPVCTFKIGEERLQNFLSDKNNAPAGAIEPQGYERHEYDRKH